MKISELEANVKVVNLAGTISHLDEPSETPNGVKVQEGILEDASGQVKLTLWDDNVGKFSLGDKIIISTGWCKTFEGELKVSTGKYGKIEKIA